MLHTSLYNRLGGAYAIAAVVSDFVDRLYTNDFLRANPFTAAAYDRLTKTGFKFYVTEMICSQAGGPQPYSKRRQPLSETPIFPTDEEWGAFEEDFRASLATFKVAKAEQKELFSILSQTKQELVFSKRQLSRMGIESGRRGKTAR